MLCPITDESTLTHFKIIGVKITPTIVVIRLETSAKAIAV